MSQLTLRTDIERLAIQTLPQLTLRTEQKLRSDWTLEPKLTLRFTNDVTLVSTDVKKHTLRTITNSVKISSIDVEDRHRELTYTKQPMHCTCPQLT